MVLIIGDNKGVNGITGFTECFVARYFCRICRVFRDITRFQLREDLEALRNPENYARDVLLNDVKLSGIKRDCVWNELDSYHCTVNVSLDIMHDFYEGICHYSLSIMLLTLIDEHYFDLDTLNERVQNLDLGLDSGNRPPFISRDHLLREKFKMSASEMNCFVRYLGLMIGDLVPEGNEYWQLYLKLIEILDLVTTHSVWREYADYLTTLIAEHHEIYINVFRKTLKPKFHLVLHLVRILLLIGPLINVWCMRLEGKHRPVVKIPAHSTSSRVNVPLTIAKRYCLSLAAMFLSGKGFPSPVAFHSDEAALQNLLYYQAFQHILPANYLNAHCTENVTICGTTYEVGTVLAIKYHDDLPMFGSIECCVKPLQAEMCCFVLKSFKTVGFNEHMHAYHVQSSNEWNFIEYENLLSFYPTSCLTGPDGISYITFRHAL